VGSALSVVLLVSGCATLSESQCIAGDWQTVGYRDGLKGAASSQLLQHQNACMKHGIAPDRDTYLLGWNAGVEQYCQPGNGFNVGKQGGGYSSICPAHLKDAYYAAYQDGRLLYNAQSEVDRINRQISQKEYRIEQLQKDLSKTEAQLISDDVTSEERLELLLETKSMAQKQGELKADIVHLKVELAEKDRQLSQLRNELAYVAH
jgi:hypothetical protein